MSHVILTRMRICEEVDQIGQVVPVRPATSAGPARENRMNRLVTTVLVTAGNHAITWLSKDGNTEDLIQTVLSAVPRTNEPRRKERR